MDFSVEAMRPDHITQVLDIERRSFSTPWSSISFANETRNPYSIALVALLGGRVIGYICASQRLDEGHILNLAVHHDHRRKGIARHLLGIVLERLKLGRCRFVYLEVRASNLPARRLYEDAGFREIGRRRLYYIAPEEDAVVMMLELPSF